MTVRIWVLLLSMTLLILIGVTLGSKLSSLGQARTEEAYRKNSPSASSRANHSASARRNTSAVGAGPGSYSNSMPNSMVPSYSVPNYSAKPNRQTP